MYWGRWKKSAMYTITGSPSKLSGRASSVWIQLVKLQIKHFIISLPCFWMSTYKEGCSCGLLIKVLFPVQARVPQGLLYSSSNTSLQAALCPSALSPGSQTSPAVPSHFLMTAEITGLQPTKKWECRNYAAFRGRILFVSRFFFTRWQKAEHEGTFRGQTHLFSQATWLQLEKEVTQLITSRTTAMGLDSYRQLESTYFYIRTDLIHLH